ncbi:MAG: hypothetical protein JRJ50_10650 [Deltaproteobacteria bacterium]|nr:hypothetical protein [Deltaproteobacteria bacterium]
MICITTGLFLTATVFRVQLIYGILIFLFAIPLLYTESRSSYLATIPALLAFVWFSEKRQGVFLILVLIGLVLPFIAPNPAKERVAYTFEQGKDRTDVVEISGIKLDTSTTERGSSIPFLALASPVMDLWTPSISRSSLKQVSLVYLHFLS